MTREDINGFGAAQTDTALVVRIMTAVKLAGLALAAAVAAQTQPVFRTGVELVTVDVTVVDRDHRPVPGLAPADFVVTVDGKPRRIVSAEYVSNVETTAAPTPAPPRDFTANDAPVAGRLIAFVVDQHNIRSGDERSVLKAAEGFLDRLTAADRVALITIPAPGPVVGFTADRSRIATALGHVHADYGVKAVFHHIASVEAVDIENGDGEMLGTVSVRECGGGEVCQLQIETESRAIAADVRRNGEATVRALMDVLTTLKAIDGPKTLVLISEGVVLGTPRAPETLPPEFGRLAADARVAVYALRLEPAAADATNRPMRSVDADAMRQSLEAVAGATRGVVLTVVGTGAPIFEIIKRELSGFYLVGFETEPGDRAGARHSIKVAVHRPRVEVRSRREFQAASAPAGAPAANGRTDGRRSARDDLLSALRSPLPIAGLPIRVSSYALLDRDPAKVRLTIVAELGDGYAAPADLAVGYTLSDVAGTAVAGHTAPARLAPDAAGRLAYREDASVAPGDYTLKVAAVDANGRIGSVDRSIHADLARVGAIAIADLVIADGRDAERRGTQMQVQPMVASGALQFALDLRTGEEGLPPGTRAALEIVNASDGVVKSIAPPIASSSDGARHVVRGVIDTRELATGDYVARAQISAGEQRGFVSRRFEIR